MVLCTLTTHAQSWKATICLEFGMKSATHMNMLTYGELSATNALWERGNAMRGISIAMPVPPQAVSLMAEAEVYTKNKTLGDITMLTLHFVAHLIKTLPLNTGLEASCPVNSRSQEHPKSDAKINILYFRIQKIFC